MIVRALPVIFQILVVVLVFQDAKTRNMNPWIWGALVFFFPLVALIIYFIMRKPKVEIF